MTVERELRAALIISDICLQFGIRTTKDGKTQLSTGGLSVLEEAFEYLGWSDPHELHG